MIYYFLPFISLITKCLQLQDDMSIRDNFDRVRSVQGQPQHSDFMMHDNQFGQEGESFSITRDSRPDHAAINDHIPSSDPLLSQRVPITESANPRRTTKQQANLANSHTPVTAGPSSPLPDSPQSLQTFPTFLGSQVTIFVIDQLIAHFPSITENHDSGNVTTTTVTGSANDSSFRSA